MERISRNVWNVPIDDQSVRGCDVLAGTGTFFVPEPCGISNIPHSTFPIPNLNYAVGAKSTECGYFAAPLLPAVAAPAPTLWWEMAIERGRKYPASFERRDLFLAPPSPKRAKF